MAEKDERENREYVSSVAYELRVMYDVAEISLDESIISLKFGDLCFNYNDEVGRYLADGLCIMNSELKGVVNDSGKSVWITALFKAYPIPDDSTKRPNYGSIPNDEDMEKALKEHYEWKLCKEFVKSTNEHSE